MSPRYWSRSASVGQTNVFFAREEAMLDGLDLEATAMCECVRVSQRINVIRKSALPPRHILSLEKLLYTYFQKQLNFIFI